MADMSGWVEAFKAYVPSATGVIIYKKSNNAIMGQWGAATLSNPNINELVKIAKSPGTPNPAAPLMNGKKGIFVCKNDIGIGFKSGSMSMVLVDGPNVESSSSIGALVVSETEKPGDMLNMVHKMTGRGTTCYDEL